MNKFIFSEFEGIQAAMFIKKEVLRNFWGAGVFSVLDRNTSLRNAFY